MWAGVGWWQRGESSGGRRGPWAGLTAGVGQMGGEAGKGEVGREDGGYF